MGEVDVLVRVKSVMCFWFDGEFVIEFFLMLKNVSGYEFVLELIL